MTAKPHSQLAGENICSQLLEGLTVLSALGDNPPKDCVALAWLGLQRASFTSAKISLVASVHIKGNN